MKALELESKVERMGELLALFDAASAARRGMGAGRMERFLKLYGQARLDRVRSSPPDFNLVEQSGLYSDERQHSAILAWLLDEAGSHGQGSEFFRAFANLCGLKEETSFTDYIVRKEFSGFESIADIVILKKGDFAFYVENKVFAGEGDDQLDREERDLLRRSGLLQIPKSRRCAVFLTPQGKQPMTGNPKTWCCVSHSQLAKTLAKVAAGVSDAKLRFFVEDWLAVLTELT